MKVGIITFHRAHNYGAVLQCYALQEVLKRMGHDVYVIDYRQPATEETYKICSVERIRELLSHPRALQGYLRRIFQRVECGKKFQSFRESFFCLSNPCYTSQDIPSMDVYITGSDQLWNVQITRGVDEVFFGRFVRPKGSLLLSYALSGSLKVLDALSDTRLLQYASSYSVLSFREQALADSVAKRTSLPVRVDIDPTLLAERNLWDKMVNNRFENDRYVLLYQVRRPKNDARLLNRKAKMLAKRMGCKVIDLTDMTTYSPPEFVSLFKYAQCVITSSFHATVFALIFERPLYSVLLRDGHDDRCANLLRTLGAEKLLVEIDFVPQPFEFDYTIVRNNLKELRLDSLQYLQNISYYD